MSRFQNEVFSKFRSDAAKKKTRDFWAACLWSNVLVCDLPVFD